jgi:hypothetical protein
MNFFYVEKSMFYEFNVYKEKCFSAHPPKYLCRYLYLTIDKKLPECVEAQLPSLSAQM